MKKVLLTLSSVILLISILLLLLYHNNNFEKEINNEITEEIKEENKEEKEDEFITEINEIDNNNVKDDGTSISDSNKSDLESHNTSNSNVVNNKTKTVKEVKKESTVSEPKIAFPNLPTLETLSWHSFEWTFFRIAPLLIIVITAILIILFIKREK